MGRDGFVHLHVHSNYSLGRAASTAGELLERARAEGMSALALTDTNALYGALPFYTLAREMGIKPIIGTVIDDPQDPSRYAVLLARNRTGYSRLCQAITDRQLKEDFSLAQCLRAHLHSNGHPHPVPHGSPHPNPLPGGEGNSKGCPRGEGSGSPHLVPLPEGEGNRNPHPNPLPLGEGKGGGWLRAEGEGEGRLRGGGNGSPHPSPLPLGEGKGEGRLRGDGQGEGGAGREGLFILTPDLELAEGLMGEVEAGTLFVELVHRGDGASRALLRQQVEFARAHRLPVVATNAVFFHDAARYDTHRVLTAIGKNSVLEALRPDELAHPQQYLKSEAEMRQLFRQVPEALTNAARIASACELEFDLGEPKFPHYQLPEGETPYSYLSKLAFDGLRERYRPLTPAALQRLQYELSVIDQLGFSEYFLIVWDIVNYARKEGIPVVGRGSAADSLVSYCLGITAVDPIAYGLYFERFLNLSRTDCPDIDLDFCWKGRDRVVQYVYDRYGADHVAMISTYNTYKGRSAFREVAKAFGLPPRTVDSLSSRLPYYSAKGIRDAVVSFPECRDFPIDEEPYRTIVSIAETIDCYPRHLSVHVGGIVISREPITELTPLQEATKGIVITQLDAGPIEQLGLVKIDLLGQRSLSLIADTVALVKRNYGVEVDPERVPDGDPQAAEVLRHGRTLGCFQIESPGMRNLLVMMQAENRGDVIKGLSLIRPGPASSGMKERFVRRRRGLEETVYLTPQLREVLGETHGVMLYQEDILKVAQAVAGFSLAEGDQLRKAISKKRSREGIEALRERFLRGALARGVRREAVAEVWGQVANFAEYSYCKAHATTYGHISYAAVWLKARYPAEFLASVINNQAGFYPPRAYLEEARRWGVRILPLDIKESEVYFSARDRAMRVGFLAVKGLTERMLRRLIQTRGEHPFRSLADFHARVRPQQAEAEALILVGAFDRFGKTRPQLLWELELLAKERASPSDTPLPLGEETEAAAIPSLPEFSLEEKVAFEEEHLQMTPTAHPLACYRDALAGDGLTRATELQEHVGREVRIAGWLTANRRAPTKDNLFMEFLTLEDETGLMEVTLFPIVYQKFGHLIQSAGPYLVEGKVEEQFGAVTLRAERLQVVPRARPAVGSGARGSSPLSPPERRAKMAVKQ